MWRQTVHQFVRKIVPFFYIRNWYTGQFEFSVSRFLYTLLALSVATALVAVALWLGRPLEYTNVH